MSLDKMSQVAAIDSDKVQNGIEVDYVVGTNHFRATITRGGQANKALQKKATDLIRPYGAAGTQLQDIDPDIQKEIRAKLLSEFVFLGWRDDDFGVTFSREECEGVLLRNPEYAQFIDAECQRADAFRKKNREDIAGN